MTISQYRKINTDHFPNEIRLQIGEQTLIYCKQLYKVMKDNGELSQEGLRYGENPGQEAAIYRLINGNLNLAGIEYVGSDKALISALADGDPKTNIFYGCGKHPSKTNLTDVDSALNILKELDHMPTAVIMKHNNPSGAAQDENLSAAFEKAYLADRIAAFGGAAVFNRPIDKDTAEAIASYYLEVVAAPDFEQGVLEILSKKRKDLRIFKMSNMSNLGSYSQLRYLDFKSLMDGGLILQQSPVNKIKKPEDFLPAKTVYKGCVYQSFRKPDKRELADLLFAWAVEQAVVSNSVLYAKDLVTVSIAGGGQDRVGIAEIAVSKAYRNFLDVLSYKMHQCSYQELISKVKEKLLSEDIIEEINCLAKDKCAGLKGAVMVSDAFFPFRDGVDVAIKEGVSAIAHPGGSLRDWESIEAVNQASPQVAMVFTGQRAFKH